MLIRSLNKIYTYRQLLLWYLYDFVVPCSSRPFPSSFLSELFVGSPPLYFLPPLHPSSSTTLNYFSFSLIHFLSFLLNFTKKIQSLSQRSNLFPFQPKPISVFHFSCLHVLIYTQKYTHFKKLNIFIRHRNIIFIHL